MKSFLQHAVPATRALVATLMMFAPAVAPAEVYKWTDERGVVNYSNALPKATPSAVRVEDRLSVYAPDRDLLEAVQAARERRRAIDRNPIRPVLADDRRRDSVPAVDPCLYGPSADCPRYFTYDSSPVYGGGLGTPRLFQPRLPVGATAGAVVGPDGYIPGLSSQAEPSGRARSAREPRASFTLEPQRPGRGRHSR